jgi:AAA domain
MIATPHEMYRNSAPDTSALPVRTVEEVISEAGENTRWIIENLLARSAVTEFSGLAKKGGKTTFWCHAIAAGARGENHAGFATEPAKYLYLTEQGKQLRRSPAQLGA